MVSGKGVCSRVLIWEKAVLKGNPGVTVSYSFLLGLDQRGDTCVREIPFHFDLLGLLPQCQQLQMFFLLLSRGGYTWKLLALT